RTHPVEAVERAGLRDLGQGDQVGQRHQFAAAGADPDLRQVGGGGTVLPAGLHHDVVLLAILHEGGDTAAAHHGFQRLADRHDADPQVGGALAIDLHPHLRPGFLVVRIHREEAGVGLHAFDHDVAPACDLAVLRTAQHDLDRVAAAADQAAADPRLRLHAGQHREFPAHALGYLRGALVALVPVLQEHDHVARVHLLAGTPAPGDTAVETPDRLVRAGVADEDLLHLLHLSHGVVEAGALGSHHRHEERAAVLGRGEFGRHDAQQAV